MPALEKLVVPASLDAMVAVPVTVMMLLSLGVSVKAPVIELPLPMAVMVRQTLLTDKTGYLATPVGTVMLSPFLPLVGTEFADQLAAVLQALLLDPSHVLLVAPAKASLAAKRTITTVISRIFSIFRGLLTIFFRTEIEPGIQSDFVKNLFGFKYLYVFFKILTDLSNCVEVYCVFLPKINVIFNY